MRFIFILCLCLINIGSILSQDTIDCSYYATKNKLYFRIDNTTNEILHLSLKLQNYDFWHNPKAGQDYIIQNDTFFLNLVDFSHKSYMSNGELLETKIDGVRWHTEIKPNKTFSFFMKIKRAHVIFKNIEHVSILNNDKIPVIRTVHLVEKKIHIELKPIKF